MENQKTIASEFINAIKTIAQKEDNLNNFQSYLEQHFDLWMRKFANTPQNLTTELKEFANMEI